MEAEEDLDGQCQGDLKGKNVNLTRIGEAARNREVWRSLVSCKSLIVSTLMEERKEDK